MAEETMASLMPGDVRDYLLGHPEFLEDNSDLLSRLMPPGQQHGEKVEDFQRFMLLKLQDHYNAIKDEHDDLMLLMQEHLQRQTRFNTAMLALLDASNFEALLDVAANDLCVCLDQEAVSVMLEAEGSLQEGEYGGVRIVAKGVVDRWLGRKNVDLREMETPEPALFGVAGENARSRALVRLNLGEGLPLGLLALAHRDPMYYATGLATEQLEFLGAVMERCFRRWIVLKA